MLQILENKEKNLPVMLPSEVTVNATLLQTIPDLLLQRNIANTQEWAEGVLTTPKHAHHQRLRNLYIFALFAQI